MEKTQSTASLPASKVLTSFKTGLERALLRINAYSLDAPLVATGWLLFLGRVFETEIPPAMVWVLASTVWLIYTADRWMDTRKARIDYKFRGKRHRFIRRYGRSFLPLWLGVLAMNSLLSWFALPPLMLVGGSITAGFSLAYLGVFHFQLQGLRLCLFKECLTGSIFAAATCGLVATLSWHQLVVPVSLAMIQFAALCSLNGLMISIWENRETGLYEEGSLVSCFPGLNHSIGLWTMLILCLNLAAAVCLGGDGSLPTVSVAAAWSCLCLLALERCDLQLNLDSRRVLADAALLLPVLFLGHG